MEPATLAPQHLLAALQHGAVQPVQLRLNENRSTLLSVQHRAHVVRVSLHRMFLQAPTEVVNALVQFVGGKSRRPCALLQRFMDAHYNKLDYSHRLQGDALVAGGQYYDLAVLYPPINERYFSGSLDLNLTWYGEWSRSRRSRITFGLYSHPLKLVKVHRILDRPEVPQFFLEYVLFHEMLHSVELPVTDPKGRTRVHHSEFKRREKAYHGYARAAEWLKAHRQKLMEGTL